MERQVRDQRWTVDIVGCEQPPQVALTPQPGRLDIDPARRGITVYEYDWQRMVRLSPAEALELLHYLRHNEAVIERMAREDDQALVDAQRQELERLWQVS